MQNCYSRREEDVLVLRGVAIVVVVEYRMRQDNSREGRQILASGRARFVDERRERGSDCNARRRVHGARSRWVDELVVAEA